MKTSSFKTKTILKNRTFPVGNNNWVIGLDIGYSAVKGISPNKAFCYPAYARKIPESRIEMRGPEFSDIRYRDESGVWAVGGLAYDEVNASDVVDSEEELFGRHRYYSSMFKVISLSGIALGLTANDCGTPKGKRISIQTGLPPKYEAQDTPLLKEALSGKHRFELRVGKSPWQKFDFEISEDDIYVMPQPLGALVSASIDINGRQIPEARQYFASNLIVFDPGFGTLDDYTVRKGRVVGIGETFPELGMREVFARTCKEIKDVYNEEIPIPEMQNRLESGKVKALSRKTLERKYYSFENLLLNNCKKVCEEAIEKMLNIHDFFSDCDYIIATGGTFDAWADIFTEKFSKMEGLKIIPANVNDKSLSNVFSNVRGYYFYLSNRLNE